MKVKIETEAAARLFGCAIGDFRDLQRHDARKLLEASDVSVADGEAAKPSAKKPAGKAKAKN